MSKQDKRLTQIINLLQIYRATTVPELSNLLGVSHMTVRRDLKELSEDNLVTIVHGGVILNYDNQQKIDDLPYSLLSEETRNTPEKIAIGKKAASMIEPADTVIIDAGSTTEYVAKHIPEEMPLTVICYTMNILLEIYKKKKCKPILAGGYFHANSLMFESPEGVALIRRSRATKAFLSASGVSEKLGITCSNYYEYQTKRAVIESSQTAFLVTDSSKFGLVSSTHFAELGDFNGVITDGKITQEYKEFISARDIGLFIA